MPELLILASCKARPAERGASTTYNTLGAMAGVAFAGVAIYLALLGTALETTANMASGIWDRLPLVGNRSRVRRGCAAALHCFMFLRFGLECGVVRLTGCAGAHDQRPWRHSCQCRC